MCYGRPEKAVSCLPARPSVARGNLRGLESRAVLREPFAVGGRPKLLPCLRAKVFGPERKASQGSLRARPQRVPSRLVGNLLHCYLPVAVDPVQGLLVVPVRANRLGRRGADATTTSPRRASPPRRRGIALMHTYNWPLCAWRQAHGFGCRDACTNWRVSRLSDGKGRIARGRKTPQLALLQTRQLSLWKLTLAASPCVLVQPDGWALGEREGYGGPCDVISLSLSPYKARQESRAENPSAWPIAVHAYKMNWIRPCRAL